MKDGAAARVLGGLVLWGPTVLVLTALLPPKGDLLVHGMIGLALAMVAERALNRLMPRPLRACLGLGLVLYGGWAASRGSALEAVGGAVAGGVALLGARTPRE